MGAKKKCLTLYPQNPYTFLLYMFAKGKENELPKPQHESFVHYTRLYKEDHKCFDVSCADSFVFVFKNNLLDGKEKRIVFATL